VWDVSPVVEYLAGHMNIRINPDKSFSLHVSGKTPKLDALKTFLYTSLDFLMRTAQFSKDLVLVRNNMAKVPVCFGNCVFPMHNGSISTPSRKYDVKLNLRKLQRMSSSSMPATQQRDATLVVCLPVADHRVYRGRMLFRPQDEGVDGSEAVLGAPFGEGPQDRDKLYFTYLL
ncbi:hypothetical protein L9F63_017708, partial [Diploptera punctata]